MTNIQQKQSYFIKLNYRYERKIYKFTNIHQTYRLLQHCQQQSSWLGQFEWYTLHESIVCYIDKDTTTRTLQMERTPEQYPAHRNVSKISPFQAMELLHLSVSHSVILSCCNTTAQSPRKDKHIETLLLVTSPLLLRVLVLLFKRNNNTQHTSVSLN